MMGKILGSVAFLIAILVGGYFFDDGVHAKVAGMFHKTDAASTVSVNGNNEWPAARSATASTSASNALADIVARGVMNVSVQNPSTPFYSSKDGHSQGFNVDFLKMLLNQNEFKGVKAFATIPYEVDSYPNVPKQLLSNKEIDIAIDGLTFNDEDLPGVVYSIPYVKDFGYSLIMAKGDSPGAGMRIGVLQGDPDAKAFAEQAFPDAKIVELSDKADANGKWIVGHINAKKVDAVMYDYPFAVAEVDGTNLQFAMTKIKGSDIQYRIGVRKGETALLSALNSAIRKVMDKPEYAAMLKTYFMSTNVAAVRRMSSGEASYVVVKGDTLSTIAQSQLGDKMKYADIQTRNNLANPNFIAVGQKLVIPGK